MPNVLLAISILLPGFLLGGQSPSPNPSETPRTGKLAAPIVLPLAGGLMARYLQQIGGRVAMWKLDSFSAHATIGMEGGSSGGRGGADGLSMYRTSVRIMYLAPAVGSPCGWVRVGLHITLGGVRSTS